MTELEYIAYFEKLASLHTRIRHAKKHQAFFCLGENNMAELQTAIKDSLHLPALLLDQYGADVPTAGDNFRRVVQAGFTVLCKFEPGNPPSERQARDQARAIAESLVKRIRRDSLAATGDLAAFRMFPELRFSGDPSPVMGGTAAGWSFSFDWTMPMSVAIDPADWSDMTPAAP